MFIKPDNKGSTVPPKGANCQKRAVFYLLDLVMLKNVKFTLIQQVVIVVSPTLQYGLGVTVLCYYHNFLT